MKYFYGVIYKIINVNCKNIVVIISGMKSSMLKHFKLQWQVAMPSELQKE